MRENIIIRVNNAEMSRNDHPIGLSLAIAANAFFVLNSGLSRYAIGEMVSVDEVLFVGCIMKWVLAHLHMKLSGHCYDFRW